MQFGKPSSQALLALFAWSLSGIAASADEGVFVFEQDRFSIGVPDTSWSRRDPKTDIVKWIAVKKGGAKIATVSVSNLTTDLSFGNPAVQTAFGTAYLKAVNGTKVKGTGEFLEGRIAYRLVANSSVAGKQGSRVKIAVVSRRRQYDVSVVSFVSDADTDPEVISLLKSFHLLDPPDPQDLLHEAAKPDSSERIGEITGTVVIVTAVAAYFVRKIMS